MSCFNNPKISVYLPFYVYIDTPLCPHIMLKAFFKITPLLISLTFFFLNQFLNWPCSLNPAQMNEFHSMLRIFDARAKNLNLTYYLSEGTLLGAVRNGKTIPWTDDIDLKLLNDFENMKIRNFSDLFVILGVTLNPPKQPTVFKLYSPKYFSSDSNSLYRLFNKAIYIELSTHMHNFEPTTLNDLDLITLDNFPYLKPKNSDQILTYYYGSSYLLPADPPCDQFNYCTSVTPSYCRKIVSFVFPVLFLSSLTIKFLL